MLVKFNDKLKKEKQFFYKMEISDFIYKRKRKGGKFYGD